VGESQNQPFQLSFNAFLRVAFQGSRVTSDGGLILVRELDERIGLSELIEEHLADSRTGRNRQFPLADLLRQSVYSRLAGYEDLNNAARLSADPTFRLIGSERVWDAEATGFQDPEKGGSEPVGPSGRKTLPGGLDWRQTGVYSQLPEGQKTNSGQINLDC